MKVLTILGTRPELIRLSRIICSLDSRCTHILVHTGQNYDKNLSDIFFKELGIRKPDYHLGVKGESAGDQIGQILLKTEEILVKEQPDRILLLGDTNSSLSSMIAKRMGIPVFHMEAGNRCYDDRVPEEVNRRIIDHSSDILMPYTERSRANLLREGIEGNRIFVTGNPILEVIRHYDEQIERSPILSELKISRGKYILATVHRAENVDNESRLAGIIDCLNGLGGHYNVPVICSLHPRTKDRLTHMGDRVKNTSIRFHEPFGFFDFIHLEKNALCVLSDSGTVQEECCLFQVPNVTLRDVTERPETIECGSNILSGADRDSIERCVHLVLTNRPEWNAPAEYLDENVSATVTKIVLGYHHKF